MIKRFQNKGNVYALNCIIIKKAVYKEKFFAFSSKYFSYYKKKLAVQLLWEWNKSRAIKFYLQISQL
ncbi:hypothetical protein AKL21_08815 [Enterococcus canintestini]|uniref:Uncharacterized protein n=1 Tax=Enterococcus canintestini TaxID=317010 RepID=A0A267HSX2_9ENTE|nr:hypothetical protein AKL21_08815 [Enterococcus canintestini]